MDAHYISRKGVLEGFLANFFFRVEHSTLAIQERLAFVFAPD
jgi:hypothetical protein